MTKEFNLSDEFFEAIGGEAFYKKDVKEFIRLETELILKYAKGKISYFEFKERRDKLIGEKLLPDPLDEIFTNKNVQGGN